MGRWKYRDSAQTYVGTTLPIVRIPSATVTVFLAGTTTAYGGTIWRNATGLTGADQYPGNPFTTDASGAIEFFLDVGISVKVQVTKPSDPTVGTLTVDYEPMVPDPRDIVTSGKGGIVYLMDYAGGLAIDGGTVDGTFAITAAVAAAAATGAKIVVPPGTFIGTWLPTDNLHVGGAGPKTILKRPNNTPTAIWDPRTKVGTKLSNVALDGNYTNNHAHVGINALVPEAYAGGTDNQFEDVVATNWNWAAFQVAGTRPKYLNCRVSGLTPSTYDPDAGGSATTNYASYYGFVTTGADYVIDAVLTDCYAENTRVGGFVLGGKNGTLANPHVRNCHRGESGCTVVATVGTYSTHGNGGGQIAWQGAWDGVTALPGGLNTQAPTGWSVICPQIGPTDGAVTTGIEVYSNVAGLIQADLDIIGPIITSQPGWAISVNASTRIRIKGGTLRLSGTAELRVNDSTHVSWEGVDFYDYKIAEQITGTSDYWRTSGCAYKTTVGGGLHRAVTPVGTHYDQGPPLIDNSVVNGGSIQAEYRRDQTNGPALLIRNTNVGGSGATSDGLEVRAGSTGFDTSFSVWTYNRGALLAQISGTGQFTLGASAARFTGDLSNATLAARMLFQSSTTNGASSLGILPNGSSTQADVAAYANATPSSAAVAAILRATATEMQIRADSPSGSYQPLVFYANNAAAMRISAAKDIVLGGGAGVKALTDTTGYLWAPYSLGKPTGTPSAPTGSSGMTVIQCDLTNNKICMWTGAAWLQTAALT